LFACLLSLLTSQRSQAAAVPLQNATATFSQTIAGGQPASQSIDGITTGSNGWAIYGSPGADPTVAQTIVWETISDVGTPGQNQWITFQLYQSFTGLTEDLGRFRLSFTTANRSAFADGLNTSGDVGSPGIWTVLVPTSASAVSATLTIQG